MTTIDYELLHHCAKDDIAYNKLITLFEQSQMSNYQDRLLAENSADGLLIWSVPDQKILYASPRLNQQFGFEENEAMQMTLNDISALVHADERDGLLDEIQQAVANQQHTLTATCRGNHRDGRSLWLQSHFQFEYLPDGTHHLTSVICRDVTQQKTIEPWLHRYQRMIHSTKEGLSFINRHYIYEIANDTLLAWLDRGREQVIGASVADLWGETAFNDTLKTYLDRCFAGETVDFALWLNAPLNQARYIHVTTSPYRDINGQITGAIVNSHDLTDRKLTEDTLHKSGHLYHDLLAYLDAGVVVHAPDASIIMANPAACKFLGYSENQMTGKDAEHLEWRFFHEDYRDMPVADYPVSQVITTGNSVRNQVVGIQHPHSGTVRWGIANGFPVLDKAGQLEQIVITFIDITDLKLSQDALRESEARLSRIVEYMPVMLDAFDDNNRLLVWNRECEHVTGYTAQEIMAHPAPLELLYPDADYREQMILDSIRDVMNFRNWEYTLTCKDGSHRTISWYNLSSEVSIPGWHTWAIGVDVTERKQIEESLRQSQARATALLDAIPDMMFRFDRDGQYLDYKGDRQELYDQSGSLIGKKLEDNSPPEFARMVLEYIHKTLDTGEMQIFEYELPSGPEHIPHIYEARMVVSGADEVTATVRNITDRKQADQHAFEIALEHERRNLLTHFIQNAAHEFRTPLATINASAYLMARAEDAAKRLLKSQQIEVQIQRITRLVDMLLLMAKLESQEAIKFGTVDLSGLLYDMLRGLENGCGKDHNLHQAIAPDLPSILGNADRLMDAFAQVIDNACRFTQPGGTIRVSAWAASGQVLVEISDDGPGIPADALPHIFETFWRQDTVHHTPGFGLGLPIAQKIIEQHGGTITVESEPGNGTTVRITLMNQQRHTMGQR